MKPKLQIHPGIAISLPERFYSLILAETDDQLPNLTAEQLSEYEEQLAEYPEENSSEASKVALQIAKALQSQNEDSASLLYLGVFAQRKAKSLELLGRPEDGLGILLDGMQLEHEALSKLSPDLASRAAELLADQIEAAMRLCALIGSISVLSAHLNEILDVLAIASTVWEPELASDIDQLSRLLTDLPRLIEMDFTQAKARELSERTASLKTMKREILKKAPRQSVKVKEHVHILSELSDTLSGIIQQELLLSASSKYLSDGLNYKVIEEQANRLIGEVERRLRVLITEKYKAQYSGGWVQHIEARHKPMYERWQRYRKRDQAAFKVYPGYSPDILEYALIEDLNELILTQWQLFRAILDFGYDDRNRSVLQDKLSQIISVRNNLAHHRTVPENELLRVRVLCTDILLALDRAGEAIG